ncbi:MAG: OsmC family protein [Candidatus Cloacimonadales bacterium]
MLRKITVTSSLKSNMAIEVQARDHKFIIDQPLSGGGDNSGPTPLEYFLSALAGCIGSIALIIAKQKEIELKAVNVRVEGELDVDVLAGKSHDVRPGYQWIKAFVEIEANISDEEKKALLREIDSRCPVSDNMRNNSKIEFELVR